MLTTAVLLPPLIMEMQCISTESTAAPAAAPSGGSETLRPGDHEPESHRPGCSSRPTSGRPHSTPSTSPSTAAYSRAGSRTYKISYAEVLADRSFQSRISIAVVLSQARGECGSL